MFWPAHRLLLAHPLSGETLDLVAGLPEELERVLGRLAAGGEAA